MPLRLTASNLLKRLLAPFRRQQSENKPAQPKKKLIREFIEHPETISYHPTSGFKDTHEATLKAVPAVTIEEELRNADKVRSENN